VKFRIHPPVMIMLSMAVFGTLAPFVRNIPVSSGELALYRAAMASGLIAGFLLFSNQKVSIKGLGKELLLLMISGVAMAFNWILLFEAYKYTTVSIATLSYYFAPVIVTVVCPILFREKLSLKQVICFVMSTFGLVLIIGVADLSENGSNLIGILFGLGAAVLYASVVLLNKFIKGIDGIQRTLLQFVAAVIVMIPYVMCTSGVTLEGMAMSGWICLLVVGLVHTGLSYCLYFTALKDVPGQQAAILSYIDPLVAIIVSVFVLGETITFGQIIGGLLILGFTLWNELESYNKKKELI